MSDSDLRVPFRHWKAFHFPLGEPQDLATVPITADQARTIPDKLTVRGVTANPVDLVQDSPHLDLFPLTVPQGYVYSRNVAVLFSELESEHDRTLDLVAAGDWCMAWFCNGEMCASTFRDGGNGKVPVELLDHDVALSLKAGRNVIAVAVLCGGGGFELHCAEAPGDIDQRRADIREREAARLRTLREQLRGPASVTVDCSEHLGGFTRPERHQSISLNMTSPAAIAAFDREVGRAAFFRCFGVLPTGFLTEGADWPCPPDELHQLRAVAEIAEEIMFPLPQNMIAQVLAGDLSEAEYERRLIAALRCLRDAAPSARWIEIFNESETGAKYLTDADLYRCYRMLYRVADVVNGERPDLPPLMLGGPTPCSFNRDRIRAFLDNVAADDDPRCRLDFVAYHQYLFRSEHHPAVVADELATVRGWLSERGLSVDLPVHITEGGLFPTNRGSDDIARDLLTQAAGCLSLHQGYVEQGGQIRPYQWTWLHNNPRKNLFVPSLSELERQQRRSESPRNDAVREMLRPYCSTRDDRFTPFGHAARLQAMLPEQRLAVEAGPRNEEGLGLYALAAGDDDRLAVLLWNYQFTRFDDAEHYRPAVRLTNLPAAWHGASARLRIYRIDLEHSHFMTGSDDLACPVDETVTLDGSFQRDIDLPISALALLRIERAG